MEHRGRVIYRFSLTTSVKTDFIRNIGQNRDNLVFVRTLIDLAGNFNLETVAECIETEEEARLLADEGVDYLQGFAFGEPMLEVDWSATHIPLVVPTGSTPISKVAG